MCTSLTLKTDDFYVGRNLDLEYAFGERVILTPRAYLFPFRRKPAHRARYAMLGMGNVTDGYPLYAEAVNEKGLYIAGLNFPGNAWYEPLVDEIQTLSGSQKADRQKAWDEISPFELIPWILSQCETMEQVRNLLKRLRLVKIHFKKELPLTPLHWHIADRNQSIVLEAMRDGLHVYDNPVGVLTNNPPFPFQLMNLNQYLNLTANYPESRFGKTGGQNSSEQQTEWQLRPFGQGMGAIGLPGDYSPASRFAKIAFGRTNSAPKKGEAASIAQFFHLLDSVAMPEGSVITPEGKYDKTTYSCCINADKGIYYYKTYENSQVTAVRMHGENLDGETLKEFPLVQELQIRYVNGAADEVLGSAEAD